MSREPSALELRERTDARTLCSHRQPERTCKDAEVYGHTGKASQLAGRHVANEGQRLAVGPLGQRLTEIIGKASSALSAAVERSRGSGVRDLRQETHREQQQRASLEQPDIERRKLLPPAQGQPSAGEVGGRW